MRSCALFDIDGTLLRGLIIRSFHEYLAEHRVVDGRYTGEITDISDRNIRGELSYRDTAERVPALFAESLRGVEAELVESHAEAFMRSHVPKNILWYSQMLVDAMRATVDLVIALSGSPIEPIRRLHGLGFHGEYGTVFEKEEGVYTGRVESNLILGEVKAEAARRIAVEHGVDLSRSVAFGDSDQDAETLGLVGLPIALNPSPRMKSICEERGWLWYTEESINIRRIVELASQLR
ncbi:MAG TPA: HAD family phosphatase [Candidatus Krumholzibacteriaceae bacterium]|nr:HAD family phosphatase [Candidatus Krumholzibacteriaceae bacterium]